MQKMEQTTKTDDSSLKDATPATSPVAEPTSKEERIKEKVVYKVVPVPYYYPVPVDAEWYYKHYEPPMRNGERGFHGYPDDPSIDHFPFPPPPAHGFPGPRSALRETHYYSSSRDEDERYLRPVSPLYRHVSSRGNHYSPPSSGARKSKENGVVENGVCKERREEKNEGRNEEEDNNEENLSPRSVSVKSEPHSSHGNEENRRNGEFESQSDGDAGRSDREDHLGDEKTSNSDSEISRKRKRFPMTFPYDQRKKILKETSLDQNGDKMEHTNNNSHVEDITENSSSDYKRRNSDESEGRVYSSHKYPSNGSTPNGHYPYVMVPLRSPPYADVRPSPRYTERSHGYYESRIYDDAYSKETSPGGGHNKDDKREIRYHPNGRRARTVFTRQQLLTLNNVFEKHPFVSGERMSELSDQLGLDRKIVKIWFQNKRQYARKKGSLVERSDEYYYDYQEAYNPTSAPPSMAAERWKVEN